MADAQGFVFDGDSAKRIGRAVRVFEGGNLWPAGYGGEDQTPPDRNFVRVMFKNSCGATLPAYGVAEISTPVTFDDKKILTVVTPTSTLRRRYLVCGDQDILDTRVGWGTYLFHSDYVLYDSGDGTPAKDEEWGVASGSFKLKKNRPGFLMSGRTKAGKEWAEAIQQVLQTVIVEPTAFIDYLSSATVNVLGGSLGSLSSTGLTISDVFNASRDIPTGEPVRVIWPHGLPLLVPIYQQITLTVKPISNILKGNSGQCLVYQSGTSTGTQVTAQALGAAVTAGKWCVAWQETASGQWYVGPWEC